MQTELHKRDYTLPALSRSRKNITGFCHPAAVIKIGKQPTVFPSKRAIESCYLRPHWCALLKVPLHISSFPRGDVFLLSTVYCSIKTPPRESKPASVSCSNLWVPFLYSLLVSLLQILIL